MTLLTIFIAALLGILAGLAVKFCFSFFEKAKAFADPVAVIVAILVFLHELGKF